MKFMEVKTEGGEPIIVNAADVVLVRPRNGSWIHGTQVSMREDATAHKSLHLGAEEGRRFREWLLSL